MDSAHLTTGPWYFAESQCQVQVAPWSTSSSTQIPSGRQGLVSFVERAPHKTQSEASSTSLWALHHHLDCGWQYLWIEYFPLPWPTPSIQCGPPSPIFFTTVGHIGGSRAADTYRDQPWLHETTNILSHYKHTVQAHPPTEDPTILGGQSRPATPQEKMDHQE